MKPTSQPLAAALALALSACSSTPEDPPPLPPLTPPTQACSNAGVDASNAAVLAEPTLETVCILTSQGEFVVALDRVAAPQTVDNFLLYVAAGYYAQTIIHRVETTPLQVIQGGDLVVVDSTYTLGKLVPSSRVVPLESDNGLSNARGTIAMARAAAADSAKAQFFLNVQGNTELDHAPGPPVFDGYAVFGHVISGMETVDAIGALQTFVASASYPEMPSTLVIVYWAEHLTP